MEGFARRALHDVATGRFERTLAGLTAAGAVVTTLEIYTSHDSASFGNKMMWWPIAVVPTLVPAGVAAVVSRRAARTVLPFASALVVANGLQGTYLHARGIAQKPGGWRMAAYNLEMGPPLFAPALASLVGGMGLLASVLRREGSDDDGPAVASTRSSRLASRAQHDVARTRSTARRTARRAARRVGA
ncbi:hypothetical protein WDZ17_12560 [Pseudokineococcus basanitobsidens]|uniref:Uncharacterized protein n=1 Tax=Pseudokineococcus basanitobsidens TaxID=1926649 RepID=A0ABU8RM37_9ACTN